MRGTIVALALVLLAGAARAEPPAGAPPAPAKAAPDPAAAARTNALRYRASEWLDARKRLVAVTCGTCKGFGVVIDSRTGLQATCPTCGGARTILAKDPFRRVTYDMRSPAWRRRDGAQDEANRAYLAARGSSRGPGYLRSSRIERVELIGDRYGIVWVFEGTDSVSRPSRWVAVKEDPSKSEGWFLYSPETDGAWPDADAANPGGPTAPEPLPADQVDALRTKLIVARKSPFALESATRVGNVLVVSLFDTSAKSTQEIDDAILDAFPWMTSESLDAQPDVPQVRLAFLARYRDSFGAVTKRTYCMLEIDRETYGKIHFENLKPEEAIGHFHPTKLEAPDGTIPWWKD
jgi:hypothetical protein